jgi:hypothetical protein
LLPTKAKLREKIPCQVPSHVLLPQLQLYVHITLEVEIEEGRSFLNAVIAMLQSAIHMERRSAQSKKFGNVDYLCIKGKFDFYFIRTKAFNTHVIDNKANQLHNDSYFLLSSLLHII